ncbi:MAG TPA: YoaK family protein [Chloroflexota bacterium]|nr:YoaK family protein [Chloroflexota bacterium]
MNVRNLLLIALTFASGAVDATSYLGLGRVFTANMTGNFVLFGLGVARVQGLEVLRSGMAFVGYVAGVAVSARVLGRGGAKDVWAARVTVVLALETAMLGALTAGWLATGAAPVRPWLEVLIVCSGMAMGMQSSAAQRLAVPSVSTTYVTGTLTSAVTELALFGHPTSGWPLRACVVLSLGVGAGIEAVILLHVALLAPFLPLLVLAAITATAARRFPG